MKTIKLILFLNIFLGISSSWGNEFSREIPSSNLANYKRAVMAVLEMDKNKFYCSRGFSINDIISYLKFKYHKEKGFIIFSDNPQYTQLSFLFDYSSSGEKYRVKLDIYTSDDSTDIRHVSVYNFKEKDVLITDFKNPIIQKQYIEFIPIKTCNNHSL